MKSLTQLKRRMVEQAYALKYSHMAGALSALPIIRNIFCNFDLKHDRFILSKGHASYAMYAVLECLGYTPDWTKHEPLIDVKNGTICTTGSLGHGLPVGAGIALAKQYKGERGRVHVLVGDGECQEGTTWETLLLADNLIEYGNLTIHVDYNSYQAISPTLCPYVLRRFSGLVDIQEHVLMKGSGIKLFEKHPDWHVHVISEAEYTEMMEELQ